MAHTDSFLAQPGECWRVPEPALNDSPPFQSPVNIWLDNAEHEISALLLSLSSEERQQLQDTSPPLPAGKELARVLGCQDCEYVVTFRVSLLMIVDDTDPSSRTAKFLPEMRTP